MAIFNANNVLRTPRDGSTLAQLIIDKYDALDANEKVDSLALLRSMGVDPTQSATRLARINRDTLRHAFLAMESKFDEGMDRGRMEVDVTLAELQGGSTTGSDNKLYQVDMGVLPAGAMVQLAYVRNNGAAVTGLASLTGSMGVLEAVFTCGAISEFDNGDLLTLTDCAGTTVVFEMDKSGTHTVTTATNILVDATGGTPGAIATSVAAAINASTLEMTATVSTATITLQMTGEGTSGHNATPTSTPAAGTPFNTIGTFADGGEDAVSLLAAGTVFALDATKQTAAAGVAPILPHGDRHVFAQFTGNADLATALGAADGFTAVLVWAK